MIEEGKEKQDMSKLTYEDYKSMRRSDAISYSIISLFLLGFICVILLGVFNFNSNHAILSNVTVNQTELYEAGYERAVYDFQSGIISQLGQYGNVSLRIGNQTIVLERVR